MFEHVRFKNIEPLTLTVFNYYFSPTVNILDFPTVINKYKKLNINTNVALYMHLNAYESMVLYYTI